MDECLVVGDGTNDRCLTAGPCLRRRPRPTSTAAIFPPVNTITSTTLAGFTTSAAPVPVPAPGRSATLPLCRPVRSPKLISFHLSLQDPAYEYHFYLSSPHPR